MQNILDQMPQWDIETIWIYVGTVIAAYIFAALYNNYKFTKGSLKRIYIAISFISLWSVIAFSACGTDYAAYKRIFDSSTSLSYWKVARVEKGYILINSFFKALGFDYKLFHMIWAFIMILLVYKAILFYKDTIDVGIAVLAFGALYCFQSMNLMRLYIAMAFTIYSYKNYMSGRRTRFLIDIIIAFFIHRSSICLLIPYAFSIIFPSKKSVWIKVAGSAILIGAFYVFRGFLFSSLMLFDNSYSLTENTDFGIANFIYHIPIGILLFYFYKQNIGKKDVFQKYFIMFLCSFIIGTISYFVTMLGRMFVYFAPIYILFPACVLNRNEIDVSNRPSYVIRINIVWFLRLMYLAFIIFRAFMMTEFFYSDQIMPYVSIFS